jgi:hypothetical protein
MTLEACEMWVKEKTVELLRQMQQGSVWLDFVAFVGVLNA